MKNNEKGNNKKLLIMNALAIFAILLLCSACDKINKQAQAQEQRPIQGQIQDCIMGKIQIQEQGKKLMQTQEEIQERKQKLQQIQEQIKEEEQELIKIQIRRQEQEEQLMQIQEQKQKIIQKIRKELTQEQKQELIVEILQGIRQEQMQEQGIERQEQKQTIKHEIPFGSAVAAGAGLAVGKTVANVGLGLAGDFISDFLD